MYTILDKNTAAIMFRGNKELQTSGWLMATFTKVNEYGLIKCPLGSWIYKPSKRALIMTRGVAPAERVKK